MNVFPQLSSGASGQYPIVKRRSFRTVTNACADGSMVKLSDGSEVTEWELTFEELTDGEMDGLRTFFADMEGRLGSFTFVDPAGNLLAWSEKPDEAVWQKDPLLTLVGEIEDPQGGQRAWRIANTGAAPQHIVQTVQAPAGLYYCFSVFVRSAAAQTLRLLRDEDGGDRASGPAWTRLEYSGQRESDAENVTFGLELPAGGTVEVFGFQAEAQTGASAYKRTASREGVYEGARFADDVLRATATAPGRHGCVLRVMHAKHS